MFSNSKNLNISGGEFNVTYSTTTSEIAQKGKHIHRSVFMSPDLKAIYRYQALPEENRTWSFTQFG